MHQKIVKLLIAIPFVVAAVIGGIVGVVAIFDHFKFSKSRELVEQASRENDPSQMELSTGGNDYIRRAILADNTETGILTMSDGDLVKYWFRSHHLSDDLGAARFVFPGGRERMISGYFCCEVMFPQDQFGSTSALDSFLADVDGRSP